MVNRVVPRKATSSFVRPAAAARHAFARGALHGQTARRPADRDPAAHRYALGERRRAAERFSSSSRCRTQRRCCCHRSSSWRRCQRNARHHAERHGATRQEPGHVIDSTSRVRRVSSCFARRRAPHRRAIPACGTAGRVRRSQAGIMPITSKCARASAATSCSMKGKGRRLPAGSGSTRAWAEADRAAPEVSRPAGRSRDRRNRPRASPPDHRRCAGPPAPARPSPQPAARGRAPGTRSTP